MLGRRLSDMQDASCQASASITADGQDTFTANCLVRSVPARDSSRCYSRGLVLLDKRLPLPVRSLLSATPDIYDGEKTQDHDTVRLAEHALFILPPGSMDTHLPACPVFGLMVGPNTFGTPEGQCECGQIIWLQLAQIRICRCTLSVQHYSHYTSNCTERASALLECPTGVQQ